MCAFHRIALVVLVGLLSTQANAQPKVPPEAIKSWTTYEQTVRKHSTRIRMDETSRDNGKVVFSAISDHIVRSTPNGMILEGTDGMGSPREPERQEWKLQVANQRYEFYGRRAVAATEWALTGVIRPDMLQAQPKDRVTTRNEIEARYLNPALAVDRVLVTRLIDHPCFQVTSWTRIVSDGREHFELAFDILGAKKPANMRDLLGGTLVFDPANRWLLKGSVLRGQAGKRGVTTITTTIQYREGEKEMPLPAEVKVDLISGDKTYVGTSKLTYEWLGETKLKDSDFTLKAFGFPEELKDIGVSGGAATGDSPWTQTDPTKAASGEWYLPVFLAAVGLILVGIVARVLLNRRRAKSD